MYNLDLCLFNLNNILIPPEWFLIGCHKKLSYYRRLSDISEYALADSTYYIMEERDAYHYFRCYTKSTFFFIGYASVDDTCNNLTDEQIAFVNKNKKTRYAVYYNFRTGRVYLDCCPVGEYTYEFRNATDKAIYYKIPPKLLTADFMISHQDLEVCLSDLVLIKHSSSLPCKLLAWLYTGPGAKATALRNTTGTLPANASLLLVCGNRIAIATRAELESLMQGRDLDLMIDTYAYNPRIQIVYLGNTGDNPDRLRFVENKGIICNYKYLDFLYFNGTFDMTPNVALYTGQVSKLPKNHTDYTECTGITNPSCYTCLDLKDSIATEEFIGWVLTDVALVNVEKLVCPRRHKYFRFIAVENSESPLINTSVTEIVFPEEQVFMPKLLFLSLVEITVPAKVRKLSLYEILTRETRKLTILSAFIDYIELAECRVEVLNINQVALNNILDNHPDMPKFFPYLKTLNGKPAREYWKELSATRLLCGRSTLQLGEH